MLGPKRIITFFDLNVRASQAQARNTLAIIGARVCLLPASAALLAQVVRDTIAGIWPKPKDKVKLGASAEQVKKIIDEAKLPLNTGLQNGEFSMLNQIIMYFGIFLGVIVSAALGQFQNAENLVLSFPGLGKMLASAMIALCVTPMAYQRLKLDPTSPFIVQFGLFFQSGVFWQVIISSLAKTPA